VPHLLLRRDDLLCALMPVNDRVLQALTSRLGGQATLGISGPLARPSRAPSAVREATWAVRAAVTTSSRTARFADATMLSMLRDPEEARVVLDRVLGRLIAYNATHSSNMVKTLDAYLRCERSWLQTAKELASTDSRSCTGCSESKRSPAGASPTLRRLRSSGWRYARETYSPFLADVISSTTV
jgi:purine catabolism regulator